MPTIPPPPRLTDRSGAATEGTRHFDHAMHHDDRHRRCITTVDGTVEVVRHPVRVRVGNRNVEDDAYPWAGGG